MKIRFRYLFTVILLTLPLLMLAFSLPSLSRTDNRSISETAIQAASSISGGAPSPSVSPAEPLSSVPLMTVREPEPLIAPPERSLSIILDWYFTPYHAPLIVARERGLFDGSGIKVTLTIPADPSVPAKLVAAQRADLALISQPQLHLLVEQGLPLIRVATLVPAPLSVLLAREDSGIASLTELNNKKIGYVKEQQDKFLLGQVLAEQSLTGEEIEFEKVGFAMTRSLADGRVDAIIGAKRHVDRQQLIQDGINVVEFDIEEYGIPLYDEMILVANREMLTHQRQNLVQFLDTLQRATLWIIDHPDEAWELVRNAEPSLDTPANADIWEDTLRYLALRPTLFQAQRYKRFEAYLKELGLVETITPTERLATDLNAP